MTYDPGMDKAPERWSAPEIDPDFRDAIVPAPSIENVDNPVGEVHYPDAEEMHRETLDAIGKQSAAARAGLELGMMVGWQILRLDVGAAPIPQSQHIRLRVQKIIMNPVTAGVITIQIGTVGYPFNLGAANVTAVDFPLVIERGSDMQALGVDGRVYILGIPE